VIDHVAIAERNAHVVCLRVAVRVVFGEAILADNRSVMTTKIGRVIGAALMSYALLEVFVAEEMLARAAFQPAIAGYQVKAHTTLDLLCRCC
jgi:hypothetical protein